MKKFEVTLRGYRMPTIFITVDADNEADAITAAERTQTSQYHPVTKRFVSGRIYTASSVREV